jgi:hypothetical protein
MVIKYIDIMNSTSTFSTIYDNFDAASLFDLRYNNIDAFVFDLKYNDIRSYVNYFEEKLSIYSILLIEFLFNTTDNGLKYYIENSFFVNIILINIFVGYKFYDALMKSIEYSNFKINNICGGSELFENVEKLIIKNIQLTQEKEKMYKLLLIEKESNMQYNYINKNLSEIHSDIMKIKNIIDDTDSRVAKKIPLITSVIHKLTKNLKNHKIVNDQTILLSDVEL